MEITWKDFEKVQLRVGTILTADSFKEANKLPYKLQIDFGDLGILKSAAQITTRYNLKELIGKQIANIMSECLVLGVVLLMPDAPVKNGLRVL